MLIMRLCWLFSGVHTLAYAFPQVRLVTTAVDPEVSDQFHILPGIGKSKSNLYDTNTLRMIYLNWLLSSTTAESEWLQCLLHMSFLCLVTHR